VPPDDLLIDPNSPSLSQIEQWLQEDFQHGHSALSISNTSEHSITPFAQDKRSDQQREENERKISISIEYKFFFPLPSENEASYFFSFSQSTIIR